MSSSLEKIKKDYPLHYAVFNNDAKELDQLLQQGKYDINAKDNRGRSPLFLAVTLQHLNCVKTLLANKCNVEGDFDGWSIVQESVCTGDPDILTTVLEIRDLQRHIQRVSAINTLLQSLKDTPDFYVEMKWEFSSWIPLMSRVAPSDTYKVYKSGSRVRIDTTLLGFDNTSWKRGNRSYIFTGDKDCSTFIEIDRDSEEYSIEQLRGIDEDIHGIAPSKESIQFRLSSPVVNTAIDFENISFERNKSGLWGWMRSGDKVESINGYECKVFSADNINFVTRTRMDHLDEESSRSRNSRTPLGFVLGISDNPSPTTEEQQNLAPPSPHHLTEQPIKADEYFSDVDLGERDVGRPKKITTKVQKFKANLWLSDTFPINLQSQVLPILNLMSNVASPHVSKLKDFITMQLPAGFPVKIEIPLFHLINAVVTFSNCMTLDNPVAQVTKVEENDRVTVSIEDSVFEIPSHYARSGPDYRQINYDDDDELMQIAIQQSLLESGSETEEVNLWEALRSPSISPGGYDDQLQSRYRSNSMATMPMKSDDSRRNSLNVLGHKAFKKIFKALELSLGYTNGTNGENNGALSPAYAADDDLTLALKQSIALSKEEENRRELELRREQEMIEEAIRLSLQEK